MLKVVALIAVAAIVGLVVVTRPTPEEGPWRVADHPALTLGSVDGTGPDVFGSVAGAVRLGTGAVMVADGRAPDVRLFAPDGRLIKRNGRRGSGPGEFQSIKAVRRCAGDSVFVYDPGLARLSVFAPTGDFVRTIDIRTGDNPGPRPDDFFCNRGGVMAYIHRSPTPPTGIGPRRPDVAITLAPPNREVVQLGTFPASERYFDGSEDFPRPLGKETSLALGSNLAYLGTGDAYEVSILSMRGEPVGTIRETHAPTRVTSKDRDAFIDDQVARQSGQGNARNLRTFYEKLQYPEILPALGGLLTDPADNVWIEEYSLPGTTARAWRVYSATGAAVSTVEMPERFELRDVGADYVLGIWRNSDDVEFVRIYPLIKAGT